MRRLRFFDQARFGKSSNSFVDPEAADQVLRSGIPFTMCGLKSPTKPW